MLINPAFVYVFVWSLCLFFYTRYYSEVFLPLSDLTLFYVLASMVSVLLSWFFFIMITGKTNICINKSKKLLSFSSRSKVKMIYLVYIWSFLSLLELLYFRDLPILSLFGLSNMSYHDYGIPSLHGFLNSIILSLSMYSMYNYLRSNNKKYLFYYFLTLMVPVVAMNRGGLTSLLIQSLFVLLVFKKINITSLLKVILMLIIFMFVFGWFGDMRYTGKEADLYSVFAISENYPLWLPKSFMWIYMYLTASLNNIENVIHSYPLFEFKPYSAFFGLLPTVIRDLLDRPVVVELVVTAFNVSSFMPNYLSAFGVYGSIIFYFLAAMVSMSIYYAYIQSRKFEYGFSLVILLHSAALSVFSDFYSIQVYVFQVLLQFFVFRRIVFMKKQLI